VIEAAIKGCGGGKEDVQQFVAAWRQLAVGKALPGSESGRRLSVVSGRPSDRSAGDLTRACRATEGILIPGLGGRHHHHYH
jgi:hypothetical protein